MFPFFILGTVFSGEQNKTLQFCPFSTNKHFLLKNATNSLIHHEVFGLLRTWVPIWKKAAIKAMFLSASRLSNYRLHSQSPPHHPKSHCIGHKIFSWPVAVYLLTCSCLGIWKVFRKVKFSYFISQSIHSQAWIMKKIILNLKMFTKCQKVNISWLFWRQISSLSRIHLILIV